MSNEQGRYRREPADLVQRVIDLEARLSRLERTPKLGTSAIDSGGLTINEGALRIQDASGNVIIELGKTSDGRYGLRVNNAGGVAQVRLGELATGSGAYGLEAISAISGVLSVLPQFPVAATSAGGTNFGSSTSYTDGSAADGPQVSCTIGPSQAAIVFVTGQVNINVDHGTSWMSYAVSGATTSASTDERGLALGVTSGGGVLLKGRVAAAFLHNAANTPLTPGVNTFKAQYRVTTGGGAASDVNASNRTIIVFPL